MSHQLVASLYVHQQLVRLAHVVLGTNIVVFSLFWKYFWLYLDESDLFAMKGERLVDLSSLHRGHVVHLVLAQLVGHLNVSQCLCVYVFPSLLSLSISLFFCLSIFSLLSSPSERASWTAAGCTSATLPRKLRTHKRKGSSPVDGKFNIQKAKSVPHPEELLSSQDTKLAEDGTIIVRHLLT